MYIGFAGHVASYAKARTCWAKPCHVMRGFACPGFGMYEYAMLWYGIAGLCPANTTQYQQSLLPLRGCRGYAVQPQNNCILMLPNLNTTQRKRSNCWLGFAHYAEPRHDRPRHNAQTQLHDS